jgi:hypothetical protein
LLAWLRITLEPTRKCRSAAAAESFVASIAAADLLLAADLDGAVVTGRSLQKFFALVGRKASLDFLHDRHPPDLVIFDR